ncbi:MAG: hypothetical protein WC656_03300 [Sulfurimonas sp.]|jgi:hypothetical protein
MALDCEIVSAEELKRLRDVQRLLQRVVIGLEGTLDNAGLEEIL